MACQLRADRGELLARAGALEEVDLFLGKVERRLDQHAQVHDALGQGVDLLGERAGQRASGRPRGGLGAGIDEVGHGLGLGQVQLVVEERAGREFARVRDAQAEAAAGLQAACEDQLQQHRAAVGLQFQDVLAGVGIRRGEVDRQALVQRLALRVEDGTVVRHARRQRLRADGGDQRGQVASGCTHDAHRTAAGGRGDGDDRVVEVGEGSGVHLATIVAPACDPDGQTPRSAQAGLAAIAAFVAAVGTGLSP